MSMFRRYIGIDYSGASTPTARLKGLRVYRAVGTGPALEVLPPEAGKKCWSRRGIAEWLVGQLREHPATIVGIDHGFSFPQPYFDAHRLPPDWPRFLEDFQRHWPTDGDEVRVDSVREGELGDGAARSGNTRWRRLTERRAGGAKSVFHFDVQGSVAKSTHSGLPWLLHLRRSLGAGLHFWPFDGWQPAAGCSVIAEIYPSLWRARYPAPELTGDQQDAFAVASWLRDTDQALTLPSYLAPRLSPDEQALALMEGWILGVG